MKSSVQRLPQSRVRLSIQVPKDMVQKAVDVAYQKLGEQVEVKGFRKGQAPKRMVFDAVGISRLREEILQRLLPDTYFSAIQGEKLVPVQGPNVNIKSQDWEKDLPEGKASGGVDYVAEVDVLPEIKLTKDYKKLRVKNEKPKVEDVTDEEVEKVIDHLRRQQATFKDVDRPAKEGDRVEIAFTGRVDNVPRDEFSSKNYPLILGQGTLLPDFEKELVGLKKGEKKNFKISMPSKSDPKKQETVDFEVNLLDVKEVILPELTDDFAKKVGQDSVLALRGAVRQSLRANKEERHRQAIEQEVADQLLAASSVDVPESLVHQEIHRMIDTLKNQAAQYKMPWEVYLAQLKKSEADLHKELETQAEKTVKFGLILGYIMNKEGIESKEKDAGRKTMQKLVEYASSGRKT